ncbi:unnamed protein product [Brassicogethes aeneus]|uniref:Ethylmalonyl-CoA decarboxylase n=1 Tax=Brassicogethes aeneus TaxID=1431903 RepID=A0A9P0BFL1_BRAAE|nr:unnamed protein product [Brassicogethes aeneus]
MEFIEDFNEIELHMSKFVGGEVFISKEYWSEGIAIIYINYPEKKNAMSGKMMVDFRKAIKELENWPDGKAVILTGLNENFCSGGDLAYTRKCSSKKDGFYLSSIMQDVLKRYRKLPMVTVSLIHGPTLGGGAEIAVFSDFILAADNVKLVQLLGERKSLDLLLNPRLLDANKSFEMGLATKIVSTEDKLNETMDFLRQYLKLDTVVIQNFKKAVYSATTENFDESINIERRLLCNVYGGPVHCQALKEKINHVKNKN